MYILSLILCLSSKYLALDGCLYKGPLSTLYKSSLQIAIKFLFTIFLCLIVSFIFLFYNLFTLQITVELILQHIIRTIDYKSRIPEVYLKYDSIYTQVVQIPGIYPEI